MADALFHCCQRMNLSIGNGFETVQKSIVTLHNQMLPDLLLNDTVSGVKYFCKQIIALSLTYDMSYSVTVYLVSHYTASTVHQKYSNNIVITVFHIVFHDRNTIIIIPFIKHKGIKAGGWLS